MRLYLKRNWHLSPLCDTNLTPLVEVDTVVSTTGIASESGVVGGEALELTAERCGDMDKLRGIPKNQGLTIFDEIILRSSLQLTSSSCSVSRVLVIVDMAFFLCSYILGYCRYRRVGKPSLYVCT